MKAIKINNTDSAVYTAPFMRPSIAVNILSVLGVFSVILISIVILSLFMGSLYE